MNKKLKIIGLIVSLCGFGLQILTNIIEEKKLDNTITEKISEALTNKQ